MQSCSALRSIAPAPALVQSSVCKRFVSLPCAHLDSDLLAVIRSGVYAAASAEAQGLCIIQPQLRRLKNGNQLRHPAQMGGQGDAQRMNNKDAQAIVWSGESKRACDASLHLHQIRKQWFACQLSKYLNLLTLLLSFTYCPTTATAISATPLAAKILLPTCCFPTAASAHAIPPSPPLRRT